MATPISRTIKTFAKPDEQIAKGGVEIDVLQIGDMKVKRSTYPSGWKFSARMGVPMCQDTHVGYAVSGHMTVEFGDGAQLEFGPGDVFVIPAGHDAWVTGDERCVIVQFDEGDSAARRFSVAAAAAKAA